MLHHLVSFMSEYLVKRISGILAFIDKIAGQTDLHHSGETVKPSWLIYALRKRAPYKYAWDKW